MYHDGQGAAQDDAAAMAWHRKGAEQSHARAQVNLGIPVSPPVGRPVTSGRPQNSTYLDVPKAIVTRWGHHLLMFSTSGSNDIDVSRTHVGSARR